MINLVISFAPIELPTQYAQAQLAHGTSPQQQELDSAARAESVVAATQQPAFTEEEVNELHVMFPSIEADVIRSVLEVNSGNKDATVTALIDMAN